MCRSLMAQSCPPPVPDITRRSSSRRTRLYEITSAPPEQACPAVRVWYGNNPRSRMICPDTTAAKHPSPGRFGDPPHSCPGNGPPSPAREPRKAARMVSRVRVWLNRTYAENVFFMDQLRRNPDDRAVEIHATHGDPDSPVPAAADTCEPEPEGLSPAAYVEYALAQCERRGIDVFVPRLHQAAIVAHRAEFEAAGTALLAPPPEAVAV